MKKDYSERKFSGKSLSEVIDLVNQMVENDFSFIEENDGTLKWASLPSLLIESSIKEELILSFISFVDEMLISEKEKVLYLITFSSLIEQGKTSLEDSSLEHLFTLTDFFLDKTVQEMKELLPIINYEVLTSTIRKKTLDLKDRSMILNYVVSEYKKVNVSNIQEFLNKKIEDIKNHGYYELMQMISI